MSVFTATIEIPRGSRNKYEIDHETGFVQLDRVVNTAFVYPADYGFFDNTLGLDGDPVDALVLINSPLYPGVKLQARPIAVLHMTDDGGEDDKVLCVAAKDPYWGHVQDLADVPEQILKEIEHFFAHYKDLEPGKWAKVGDWQGQSAAVKVIEEGLARFQH